MGLKLYNTLTRKKEILRPRKKGKINIFVCGPTVYDFAHLGHARTYVVFDMIVKYLKEKGFDVSYLQNITDIDDKIIKRAREKKTPPKSLAHYFEKECLKDMKSLKIDSPTKYARATDHIQEIISQVKRLLKKDFAYKISGGIYYDISKFKDYGKLSGRTILQAEDAVSRIDEAREKRNKGDFCLWKTSRPGEPRWLSPFNWGRPGWHIEDTAITEKYFGPQYDIHGGARDLIFPHHEAEIAQMEAISGKKPLVKYWLHTGFLTVKGEKMAKSLGNFITIRDFLKENPAYILRLLLLRTHYRSPIDFNETLVSQTKKDSERIAEFVAKLRDIRSKSKKKQNTKIVRELISKTKRSFNEVMNDDFNTPEAVASIFNLVKRGNFLIDRNEISAMGANEILKLLKSFDRILEIGLTRSHFVITYPARIIRSHIYRSATAGRFIATTDRTEFKKVLKLKEEREKARKRKDWQKADEIRKKIKDLGYWLDDTKEGTKIKKL